MEIKSGAILIGLDINIRPALVEADRIWKATGQELVVTSGLDGTHSAGSLHYYGRAVDFRTRYFSLEEREMVLAAMRASLSDDFDIILHSSHMHVEYDPK